MQRSQGRPTGWRSQTTKKRRQEPTTGTVASLRLRFPNTAAHLTVHAHGRSTPPPEQRRAHTPPHPPAPHTTNAPQKTSRPHQATGSRPHARHAPPPPRGCPAPRAGEGGGWVSQARPPAFPGVPPPLPPRPCHTRRGQCSLRHHSQSYRRYHHRHRCHDCHHPRTRHCPDHCHHALHHRRPHPPCWHCPHPHRQRPRP